MSSLKPFNMIVKIHSVRKKHHRKHHHHRYNSLLCQGTTTYWFFNIIASLAFSVSVLIMKAVSELTLPAEEEIGITAQLNDAFSFFLISIICGCACLFVRFVMGLSIRTIQDAHASLDQVLFIRRRKNVCRNKVTTSFMLGVLFIYSVIIVHSVM